MNASSTRSAFTRAALGLWLGLAAIVAPLAAQTLDATPETGKPLWEIGAGVVGAYGPDYPASDEYSANGLPFPFVLYRGEYLRIDDEAARIIGVETPAYSFGISAGGAFPAKSGDNIAREGMPDLGYLAELGPELVLNGPGFADGRGKSALAFQARAVLSADSGGIGYQGAVFETNARSVLKGVLGGQISGSVGAVFASERVHDYFYEVDPAFATATRPAYDAQDGYMGAQISIGYSREIGDRTLVYGGAKLGLYQGAANRDSPLFRTATNASVSFGLIHTFFTSRTRVAE